MLNLLLMHIVNNNIVLPSNNNVVMLKNISQGEYFSLVFFLQKKVKFELEI